MLIQNVFLDVLSSINHLLGLVFLPNLLSIESSLLMPPPQSFHPPEAIYVYSSRQDLFFLLPDMMSRVSSSGDKASRERIGITLVLHLLGNGYCEALLLHIMLLSLKHSFYFMSSISSCKGNIIWGRPKFVFLLIII